MKKFCLIALIIISIFALASCKDTGDVPEGMQLVGGGEGKGYYFYAPEEWTVTSLGGIDAAYVSNVNTTSVTFTEIDADTLEYDENTSTLKDYFLYEYFNQTKGEFPTEPTVTKSAEVRQLGTGEHKAEAATMYAYKYAYDGVTYGFMQYFAVNGGRCYVLTYSAILDVIEGYERSRYDEYLEMFTKIVENMRFTSEKANERTEGDGTAEEFRLVSDKRLCGFEFYAHKDFALDYASGIVSVRANDGSTVSLAEATGTGTTVADYMLNREKELSAIVTNFTWITPLAEKETLDGGKVMAPEGVPTKLGNLPKRESAYNYSLAFEYTYEYNGDTYHVYQIAASDYFLLSGEGYVFTYTAKEENYAEHLDEVYAMIERVVFN